MAGKRVHFVMPDDLVARIDAACAEGVSRGEFVRRAVERALSEAYEPSSGTQAGPGSVSSSEGVRPAAPAEQPIPKRAQPLQRTIASHQRVHAPTCKCGICKPVK